MHESRDALHLQAPAPPLAALSQKAPVDWPSHVANEPHLQTPSSHLSFKTVQVTPSHGSY